MLRRRQQEHDINFEGGGRYAASLAGSKGAISSSVVVVDMPHHQQQGRDSKVGGGGRCVTSPTATARHQVRWWRQNSTALSTVRTRYQTWCLCQICLIANSKSTTTRSVAAADMPRHQQQEHDSIKFGGGGRCICRIVDSKGTISLKLGGGARRYASSPTARLVAAADIPYHQQQVHDIKFDGGGSNASSPAASKGNQNQYLLISNLANTKQMWQLITSGSKQM